MEGDDVCLLLYRFKGNEMVNVFFMMAFTHDVFFQRRVIDQDAHAQSLSDLTNLAAHMATTHDAKGGGWKVEGGRSMNCKMRDCDCFDCNLGLGGACSILSGSCVYPFQGHPKIYIVHQAIRANEFFYF